MKISRGAWRQILPVLLTMSAAQAKDLVVDNEEKNYTKQISLGTGGDYGSLELKGEASVTIDNSLYISEGGQLSLNQASLSLIALEATGGNVQLENGSVLRLYPSSYEEYAGVDVAFGKEATCKTTRNSNLAPNMLDGEISSRWRSRAIEDPFPAHAMIDLGDEYAVNRWRVAHRGANESNQTSNNTKAFRLQYSTQETPDRDTDEHWINLDVVTDNSENWTDRRFEPTLARFLRLAVDEPSQAWDPETDELYIQLLEVYGGYPSGNPEWYSLADRMHFTGSFSMDESSRIEIIYPDGSQLPATVTPYFSAEIAETANVYIGYESDEELTKMEFAYRRWIVPGAYSDLYDPQGDLSYEINDESSFSNELWTLNGNNSVSYLGGSHEVGSIVNIGGGAGDDNNQLVLDGAELDVLEDEVSVGDGAGSNSLNLINGSTLDSGHYLWIGKEAAGNVANIDNSTLKAAKVLVGDGNSLNLTNGGRLDLDAYADRMDSQLGNEWANHSAYLDVRGEINIDSSSAIYLRYPSEDALPLAVNLLHYESSSQAYEQLQLADVYAYDVVTGTKVLLKYNKGFWVQPGILPDNFELPFKETGKTEVSYMAEDAFSPERVEEGRKIYVEMCATCHVESGKDMPMFGANFGAARVVSSTKKFAGALGDPEAGEKVYEFLRYNHPGPFQNFADAFLQPGPLALKPGILNPVLNENDDFYAGWTGYLYPTIEDVHFNLNKYDRTQMLSSKKRFSWMEWMPHSVPPAISDDAVKAHIAENGTSPASLWGAVELNRWFWRNRYGYEYVNKNVAADGWSYDGIVMAQYAQGSWLAMQSYEHHLPDWVDGKWDKPGSWHFELDSAVNREIHQHGVRIGHTDVENNSRRKAWFNRMKHGWWDFCSGIAPTRDPALGPKYGPWGCWLMTYSKPMSMFHGMTIRYFTYHKSMADFESKGTKNRDGRDNQVYERNGGYGQAGYNETGFRQHAAFILHATYLDWKYFLGKDTDGVSNIDCLACGGESSNCSVCGGDGILPDGIYHTVCSTCSGEGCDSCNYKGYFSGEGDAPASYSELHGLWADYGSAREERYMRAFVQRYNRMPKWGGELDSPVVLCSGTEHVAVGEEYTLFISRMQGLDGDISISANNLPDGAVLVVEPDGFGINDYYVKWTPQSSDIGNHTFKIKASSSEYSSNDTQSISLQVSQLGPEPIMDPITETVTLRLGQYLTLPFTINRNYRKEMEFEMIGSAGMAFQNHRKRGGIYYIKPNASDLGVHKLTFIARDEHGRENQQTMVLEVLPNSAPSMSLVEMGEGPGHYKNIFRGRAGEEIRMHIAVSDPEGNKVRISTSHGYPGTIEEREDGTYDFVIPVTDDLAEHLPGPNVFTIAAQDDWGAESHLVTLVYFEPRDSNLNHHPWAVTPSVQYVYEGEKVYLDGSASDDPDGDEITYQWSKWYIGNSAADISLKQKGKAVANFVAPAASEPRIQKFHLQVTDSHGASDYNVARVVILPGERPTDEESQLVNYSANAAEQSSSYKMITGVAGMIYEAEDAMLDGIPYATYDHSNAVVAEVSKNTSGSLIWHVTAAEQGNYVVRVNTLAANLSNSPSGTVQLLVNGEFVDSYDISLQQGPYTAVGTKNYGHSIGTIYTIDAQQGIEHILVAPLTGGVNKVELLIENTGGSAWGVDNMMVYCSPNCEEETVVVENLEIGCAPALACIPDGAIYLSDLEWDTKSGNIWLDTLDGAPLAYGSHTYEKGLGIKADTSVSYQLAGEYASFNADTFVPAEGNRTIYYEIRADGELVFSSAQAPLAMPSHCSLDVSGVNTLSFEFYRTDGNTNNAYAVLGDAYFLKQGQYAEWIASQGGCADAPAAWRFDYNQPNLTFQRFAFGDVSARMKNKGPGTVEYQYDFRPGVEYKTEISSDLSNWVTWELAEDEAFEEEDAYDGYKTRKLLMSCGEEDNKKLFIRVSAEQ